MSYLSLAILALLLVCTAAAAGPTLYVSPTGNDRWSGRLPAANQAHTDGPFAGLWRARLEVRRLRAGGEQGPITVLLRGGLYELPGPFQLSQRDSATTWAAYPGEHPRLVGGRAVTGFTPVTDQAILARLEEKARGQVLQADLRALGITDYGSVEGGGLELFFDGRPMTLARYPNQGWMYIKEVVGGDPYDIRGTWGDRIGKFTYDGDRPQRWAGEKEPWVHGYWFWDWSDQRHPVAAIDTDKHTIEVKKPYHGYGYRKGQWFYALNLLSEIDEPGEWYLDRQAGVLYFWPPAPVTADNTVVSVLPTLFAAKGTSDVTLRGLTLEAARGTAVTFQGGDRNQVVGCTIQNVGAYAVTISGGRGSGVYGCDITQTGQGGISLSGGDRRTLTPCGHFAENNHIHHYSRWNRMYNPAVAINGVGIRVANNLIHDAPHEAIAFGGNDHLIEYNEIYNVCLESNDAGAIYNGRDWTQRGTMIRCNYLHDIQGFENRGCVGVYLDDMLCGINIDRNLFRRVTMAAFIGGGRDCTIRNNVFVDCSPAVHIDARALGWAADTVPTTMVERLEAMPYKTPPWSTRFPQLLTIMADDPAAPKGNVVARNICVGGQWLHMEDKAKPGTAFQDNLVDQDPKFVDAEHGDYQLQPDSPAWQLGFERLPLEKIGLYEDPRRATPLSASGGGQG